MVVDGGGPYLDDHVPLLSDRDCECGNAEQEQEENVAVFSVSTPTSARQEGCRRKCRPARVCIVPLVTVLGTLVSLCVWENMLRREGQGMLLQVANVVKTAPVRRGCAPEVIDQLSQQEKEAAQSVLHEIVVSRQQSEHFDLHSRECCLLGTVLASVKPSSSAHEPTFQRVSICSSHLKQPLT